MFVDKETYRALMLFESKQVPFLPPRKWEAGSVHVLFPTVPEDEQEWHLLGRAVALKPTVHRGEIAIQMQRLPDSPPLLLNMVTYLHLEFTFDREGERLNSRISIDAQLTLVIDEDGDLTIRFRKWNYD